MAPSTTPSASTSRTPTSTTGGSAPGRARRRPMSADLLALGRQGLAGLRVLLALTVLTGLVYPVVVLGIGQALFGWRAGGSLVDASGQHQRSVTASTVGSALIGQTFTGSTWFVGRPSAAGDGYDTLASAASNLGPENADLLRTVRQRRSEVARREGVAASAVPPDAVTASASGLDPQISPAYARIQVARVARARDLPVPVVRRLVAEHTSGRTWGFLGEPRVDVLSLNIDLARADG